MLQHIDKLRPYFNSNARNPAPKLFCKVYCDYLCLLLVLSTRFRLLFGTLKYTASECSEPSCGNQCGQKRFPPKAGTRYQPKREAFLVSGWLDCNSTGAVMQGFSGKAGAQYLRGYRQRKAISRKQATLTKVEISVATFRLL